MLFLLSRCRDTVARILNFLVSWVQFLDGDTAAGGE